MKRIGTVWSIIGIAIVSLLLAGAMPAVPPDDAGHAAFVRQVVPKLLGRKPRGAEEVKVLADLAALVGREAVLRALMDEPEFIEHWTNVIADDLRVQREGARGATMAIPECFGDPLRSGPPAAALARHVRSEPISAPDPDGAFNMTDLIRSALILDDLSPVYRAYPVALRSQLNLFFIGANEEQEQAMQETAIGNRYSLHLLNRGPSCLTCHNSTFSRSGQQTGWSRTHPIPYNLEAAVFGAGFPNFQGVIKTVFPIFRNDQFEGGASAGPWGISGCGGIVASLSGFPPRRAAMAGISGTTVGIADLAQAFKDGVDSLAANGPVLTPQPNPPFPIPPKQALAYMTAMTVAENVWEEIVGERLTIANYYPRNPEQRDMLMEVGEQTFLKSGWSLKVLVIRILTSDFFNRRSPDLGSGSTPYRLPMIVDPWVADDPRSSPPPPPLDPKELNNGQGEFVHRPAPSSLLYAMGAALDWPAPQRFPVGSGYADAELVRASGQYISESEQGRKGVDFQGLLVWESKLALCRKPSDVASDWVDRVLTEIPKFNAANPAAPLTIADIASTARDWLIGDARIGSVPPKTSPGSLSLQTERDAVAGLFGAQLNTPAMAIADLYGKLRSYCGVLLKTPQFLLTGIDGSDAGFAFPRLRVCNSGPCTYGEMCEVYARTLARIGQSVECDGANRAVRQIRIASAPVSESGDAPKSGWLAVDELMKRSLNEALFTSLQRTIDDSPPALRQTGPDHPGLAGDLPASLEEANERLRRYRASEAFARSHPDLKR